MDTFAPSVTIGTSISTPQGGRGHGVQVWRAGPGGFTFMEEEHNYTPAGEVFIVGYTWWDATRKRFGGMECNSQWPIGCDLASAMSLVDLSWDGKRFVVDIRSEKDPSGALGLARGLFRHHAHHLPADRRCRHAGWIDEAVADYPRHSDSH